MVVARNLGILIFLPGDGDELLELLGLMQSETGVFCGERRISPIRNIFLSEKPFKWVVHGSVWD